jgi:hypothetical protein
MKYIESLKDMVSCRDIRVVFMPNEASGIIGWW